MKIAMSPAAAALVRALLARAGGDRNRILLREVRSVDWQSLTFIGERHEIRLRLAGPGAGAALALLRSGLADAEWNLDGHVVADILIVGEQAGDDGSMVLDLEALTLTA